MITPSQSLWSTHKQEFIDYLKLERAASPNTVAAYQEDLNKLQRYMETHHPNLDPTTITDTELSEFLSHLAHSGIAIRTQARILSGIRTFFHYLLMNDKIITNPARILDAPKIPLNLPDVLTVEEIDSILSAIDLSLPEGHRNRAIIETLYSCGLRVSELTTLLLSNIDFQEELIKVKGKGSKERLIPISKKALRDINNYLPYRSALSIAQGHEDYLFLNRRGKRLSRVYIFMLIKDLAISANITKSISPHTFRHSFATHLVEGGADIRSVQELLGHESILTTEIYTHLDTSYLRQAIIEYHPRGKF